MSRWTGTQTPAQFTATMEETDQMLADLRETVRSVMNTRQSVYVLTAALDAWRQRGRAELAPLRVGMERRVLEEYTITPRAFANQDEIQALSQMQFTNPPYAALPISTPSQPLFGDRPALSPMAGSPPFQLSPFAGMSPMSPMSPAFGGSPFQQTTGIPLSMFQSSTQSRPQTSQPVFSHLMPGQSSQSVAGPVVGIPFSAFQGSVPQTTGNVLPQFSAAGQPFAGFSQQSFQPAQRPVSIAPPQQLIGFQASATRGPPSPRSSVQVNSLASQSLLRK